MKHTFSILLGFALAACGSTSERPAPAPEVVSQVPEVASSQPEPATVAPVDPPVDPRVDKRFRKGQTRGGRFTVLWRSLRGDVPRNEHFEIEVVLYRNVGSELEPLPGARLAVSGWMPDHGHGMIRKPQATDLGAGRYLVKGMLLQMGGHWQVFFDVLVDSQSERAQFDLVL